MKLTASTISWLLGRLSPGVWRSRNSCWRSLRMNESIYLFVLTVLLYELDQGSILFRPFMFLCRTVADIVATVFPPFHWVKNK